MLSIEEAFKGAIINQFWYGDAPIVETRPVKPHWKSILKNKEMKQDQKACDPIRDRCFDCYGTGKQPMGLFCAHKSDPTIPVPVVSDEICQECEGFGTKLNSMIKFELGYQFSIHSEIRLPS